MSAEGDEENLRGRCSGGAGAHLRAAGQHHGCGMEGTATNGQRRAKMRPGEVASGSLRRRVIVTIVARHIAAVGPRCVCVVGHCGFVAERV